MADQADRSGEGNQITVDGGWVCVIEIDKGNRKRDGRPEVKEKCRSFCALDVLAQPLQPLEQPLSRGGATVFTPAHDYHQLDRGDGQGSECGDLPWVHIPRSILHSMQTQLFRHFCWRHGYKGEQEHQ